MRKQTHKVDLTSEERQILQTLVRKGEHAALKLMRAHILLKADRNGPCWTDARISEAFGCDAQTAHNVRNGLPPEDPTFPVVAMDERPVVLHEDLRSPMPAKPRRIARIDSEYKRRGTAAAFMFTAPFQGWRRVSIRDRHTAVDWAEEVRHLLDEVYPNAVRVTLVYDNLNTHKIASLYKAFPAEVALGVASRLE